MNLIQLISDYVKEKAAGPEPIAPRGLCPNCWGNQEYNNLKKELVEDVQKSVNNNEKQHAFIQAFVVKHVTGIALKNSPKGAQCPTCKSVY